MVELSTSLNELFQTSKPEYEQESELFYKCGEIFLERFHDELIFFCFHCDKKLRSISLFVDHIRLEHDISLEQENINMETHESILLENHETLEQEDLDDNILEIQDDFDEEDEDFVDVKPDLVLLNVSVGFQKIKMYLTNSYVGDFRILDRRRGYFFKF